MAEARLGTDQSSNITGSGGIVVTTPSADTFNIDASDIPQIVWLSASATKLSSNPAASPTGTLISIATDTGGDTATAAICSVRASLTDSSSPVNDNVRYLAWPEGNSSLALDVAWVGHTGSAETSATSRDAAAFIVPVDGSEEFRIAYSGSFSTSPTFVLQLHGYIK